MTPGIICLVHMPSLWGDGNLIVRCADASVARCSFLIASKWLHVQIMKVELATTAG